MGRTILHTEPALRGGPKLRVVSEREPKGWRKTDLHRTAWPKAHRKSCADPQPGKTAADTGRAKRAAEFRDELRKP